MHAIGRVHTRWRTLCADLTTSVLSKSRLTRGLPFIDIGRCPLVPGSHLVTSRSPSTGARRTRQGDWPGLLAERGRRATASIHSRHHQRGTLFWVSRTSRRFRLALLTTFCSLHVDIGATRPLAVLAGHAALLDRGLCIQWDVHTEEHGPHPQLLRHSSQRGEVRGLVSKTPPRPSARY
jgi:hypothetical protein